MQLEIYKAEVIYNGLGTPQANAGVLIQENGREEAKIMNITSLKGLEEIAESVEMSFPIKDKGFAISPAPVNARIELTDYSLDDVTLVVETLQKIGTRVVGLIVNDAELMNYLLAQSLEGVIYWQVNDPNPATAEASFNQTVESFRAFKALETKELKVGLAFGSIHAVSEALLTKLALLCKQNRLPLQISVAKSQADYDLHAFGTGALVKTVLEQNSNWQASMLSPVQYLKKLRVLDAEPTLVHMNYVDEEDIRRVQHAGCTVIHCPRLVLEEQQALKRFPWEIYMKHGVEVAFASGYQTVKSRDFDVRKDVQVALVKHQEKISPLAAVRSAVKGGYRALMMKPPIINKGDSASKLYIW